MKVEMERIMKENEDYLNGMHRKVLKQKDNEITERDRIIDDLSKKIKKYETELRNREHEIESMKRE